MCFSQYLLTTVESALADFLGFGLLTTTTTKGGIAKNPGHSLRLAIDRTCQDILPNAIGLSDAFGFTDWELDRCGSPLYFLALNAHVLLSCAFDSALGVYDGNVYEALWERTKIEPMNQRDVTDAYEVCFVLLHARLGFV